jgi:DNA-binding response OmpR family regulator
MNGMIRDLFELLCRRPKADKATADIPVIFIATRDEEKIIVEGSPA